MFGQSFEPTTSSLLFKSVPQVYLVSLYHAPYRLSHETIYYLCAKNLFCLSFSMYQTQCSLIFNSSVHI